MVFTVVYIAAGRQKTLQRRGRVVVHPASRRDKLDRGLALAASFGAAGDEEVVPSRGKRGARDVSRIASDRAGRSKGLEGGAVGRVDVAVFFKVLAFKRERAEMDGERRERGRDQRVEVEVEKKR